MRQLIYKLPRFKGQQRLLLLLDKYLGPCKMTARFGIHIEGYYSSLQDCAFLRSTSENPILEDLINKLTGNGVFIDIGANCGYYSALASKKLGESGLIISVEPSFREYRRLLFSISNNYHKCAWLGMNQAFGDFSGIIKINVNSGHSGVNHITKDGVSGDQFCFIDKPSNVFSNLISTNKQIDLVKIDVEGFELSVLKGMEELLENKRIKALQVEVTDQFLLRAGSSKNELYEFMNKHGYTSIVNSNEWQYNEVFITK